MKKLLTIYIAMVTVLTFGYSVSQSIPQWYWTQPLTAQDNIYIRFTMNAGLEVKTFTVYASGIKIAEDVLTGSSGVNAIGSGQYVNKSISVAMLNTQEYDFKIKACTANNVCTTSGERQIYITASVGDEESDSGGGHITPPDVNSSDVNRTTPYHNPDTTVTQSAQSDTSTNRPSRPYISKLIAGDSLDVVWNMWWGKKGNKVKLYVHSILIKSIDLGDYDTEYGTQSNVFKISLEDLKEKGVKSELNDVSVSLCYDDYCNSSPQRSLVLQFAPEPSSAISNIPPSIGYEEEQRIKEAQQKILDEQNSQAQQQEQEAQAEATKAKLEEAKLEELKDILTTQADNALLPIEPEIDNIDEIISDDFDISITKPWGIHGTSWKLEHTIEETKKVVIYELGEATVNAAEPQSSQKIDLNIKVLFTQDDAILESDPTKDAVAIVINSKTINLTTSKTKQLHHSFVPILCNDKGCTRAIEKTTTVIMDSSLVGQSRVTGIEDRTLLPALPKISTLPKVISSNFDITLTKWWGTPGTTWKLEHMVKETNKVTTYELGEAIVNQTQPQNIQDKTINFTINFSDNEEEFKANDILTTSTKTINGDIIEIVASKVQKLNHSFIAVLCNDKGCVKSDSTRIIIMTPELASESLDAVDKNLRHKNILGLKMDPSTWSEDEKRISKSLSIWNNEIPSSSSSYTPPAPKECSNIDSNGKINGKESMVYYGSWSVDKGYYPKNLDGCSLTGVLFAFAYPSPNGRLHIGNGENNVKKQIGSLLMPDDNKYQDDPKLGFYGVFNQLIQFKKEYTHIKTYLSVGGWNWSTYFAAMADNEESRKTFIADAVELVRTFQFDGIDIDWEVPTNKSDRDNLTTLLKELRTALDDAALNLKPGFEFSTDDAQKSFAYRPADNKFTLSVAVPSDSVNAIQYFDIAAINPIIDFAIYKAYDFNGDWNAKTGHLAPLYDSGNKGESISPYFNVSQGLNAYIQGEIATTNPHGFNSSGFSPSKMVLGLAYYGRGWDTDSSKIYQKVGKLKAAQGTELGAIGYGDLLKAIFSDRDKWKLTWDAQAKAAMAHGAYTGSQKAVWTYDDPRSICEKVKYAHTKNIKGVFAWESSFDNGNLLNSQTQALKTTNIDCDSLYFDSDYDEIYDGGTTSNNGDTIKGDKLSDEELDKARGPNNLPL